MMTYLVGDDLDGKVWCLDADAGGARETDQVLVGWIPCHTVYVRFLKQKLLCVNIEHWALVLLVDDGQLFSFSTQIETSDGTVDFDQTDGQNAGEEDIVDLSILQAHQQTLLTIKTTGGLDISDRRVEAPLILGLTGKCQRL